MVDPTALGRPHSVFVASNDADAKVEVADLLRSFGWQDVIDLGDLGACRAMEQLIYRLELVKFEQVVLMR